MISRSLQNFVGEFDLAGAAEQHLRYRRETQIRRPGGRVENTVEVVEGAAGVLRRLQHGLPGHGQWAGLRGALEAVAATLDPSTWPIVLVEVSPATTIARWLGAGASAAGFCFYDQEPLVSGVFREFPGALPGLSLQRFGLVAVRIPPVLDVLEWLDRPDEGVAGLWLGNEEFAIPPEPELSGDPDGDWDGHDLVMGKSVDQHGRAQYPSWFNPATAGRGVRIAILDTGISTSHRAFEGGAVVARADFTGEGIGDRHGHGTHCAGIAAGRRYGGGRYIGVAPAASLLDAKVLNSQGSGQVTGILMGLEWAVRQRAHVVSMSLGGRVSSADGTSPLSRAVQHVVEREGIFVAVSAGNAGPGPGTIGSPGDAPGACTVGAVDARRVVTTFSSRGPTARTDAGRNKPNLCAPGAQVVGPDVGNADDVVSKSGTSMAAPFVAGAAAVLLSTQSGRRSPAEIIRLLGSRTNPVQGGDARNEFAAGKGILSLHNAMQGVGGRIMTRLSQAPVRVAAAVAVLVATGAGLLIAAPFVQKQLSVDQIPGGPQDRPRAVLATAAHRAAIRNGRPSGGTAARRQDSQPTDREAWSRPSCYDLDAKHTQLRLRVYRGMTLSDLAFHFDLKVRDIRSANSQLERDDLRAGESYVVPVGHLAFSRHHVVAGDTLGRLTGRYDLPTLYTIRTLNCLPSADIEAGDALLVFRPQTSAKGSQTKAGAGAFWHVK